MVTRLPKSDPLNLTGVFRREVPMPPGSFLSLLPDSLWSSLLTTDPGSGAPLYPVCYAKDKRLPLGPGDETVYLTLTGCVAQRRYPYGRGAKEPVILRFRGAGQLLGEAKLLDPCSSVETVCLSDTWVLPYSADHLNRLLGRRGGQGRGALLASLEERNRTDEMIYGTVTRPPLRRVGALLHHLAVTAGTGHPDGSVRITGPRQTDLAEALLVSRSTVENAVSVLRTGNLVASSYRRFVVTDPAGLARLAGVPRDFRLSA
ncbi:helix-turn-helix domain-containing protein [Streptomyces sp. TRM 70361]|uniref:Crp/Fnr family transcriptional regulator n=1 Tax=Streptomyces sp. TRM 70361 TaxID=3116553 RepID=UPI002E7B70FE|nr:helix-turn-helix domain-containing protein [Streptomyces sp. TRM 70361]MEE1942321.1 helix-turn-helix domain-containing protein [Streptomyces sp. TRM 70361]